MTVRRGLRGRSVEEEGEDRFRSDDTYTVVLLPRHTTRGCSTDLGDISLLPTRSVGEYLIGPGLFEYP